MVSNAIVTLCTGLMVGALIWVVISEHKGEDYGSDKNEKSENSEKEEEK